MCLLTVDDKPRRKFGIGYKSVRIRAGGGYECYDHRPHAGTVTYPLNQWLTDPNDGEADSQIKYRTGFHVSLDKEELRRCNPDYAVVIKVRFRKVVATSCDTPDHYYGSQVVAREIMNLGEV